MLEGENEAWRLNDPRPYDPTVDIVASSAFFLSVGSVVQVGPR